jgi:hypothetical protein
LEHNAEQHANFTFERLLYDLTPFMILALFIAGLPGPSDKPPGTLPDHECGYSLGYR